MQFARGTTDNEPTSTPLQKTTTWETDEENAEPSGLGKERQGSFFGRLKALASPASTNFHVRTPSNQTGIVTPQGALSPQSERSEPTYPVSQAGESEMEAAEADVEADSSDEGEATGTPRVRRRRKTRRPQINGGGGATPSTPMGARFASFIREHQMGSSHGRPETARRRSAVSDVEEEEEARRAGVSEDEGRDRIRNAWKRGIEGARAMSYSTRRNPDNVENPGERRPMNLRRITGMDAVNSPFRMRTDRANSGSVSAQRWKQVKAGLKLLGQKKRDERITIDHQKSAQLMAELLAGAPAALVFASMFQRDEHDHRKIPVLLEQLKIRIPTSQTKESKSEDRHMIFRIELEYGNGAARMNWVIHRTLRDFVNLHLKYKAEKLSLRSDDKSRAKIPHFPKTAFPYARGARGLFTGLEDEADEDQIAEESGREGNVSAPERPVRHRRGPSSFAGVVRRKSSLAEGAGNVAGSDAKKQDHYSDRQRRKLERYLQQMSTLR